jgi:hypothetical protein
VLAYVFWHTPAGGVARDEYEARLRAFHATLEVPSASFRDGEGYEDWYLIRGWAELGELNDAAVAAVRRAEHDAAAALAADGAAGVYLLVRGVPQPPAAVRWVDKPRGVAYDAWLAEADAPSVWQRQMTLGPRAEFALVEGPLRERVA